MIWSWSSSSLRSANASIWWVLTSQSHPSTHVLSWTVVASLRAVSGTYVLKWSHIWTSVNENNALCTPLLPSNRIVQYPMPLSSSDKSAILWVVCFDTYQHDVSDSLTHTQLEWVAPSFGQRVDALLTKIHSISSRDGCFQYLVSTPVTKNL